jgi:hypothetical protein
MKAPRAAALLLAMCLLAAPVQAQASGVGSVLRQIPVLGALYTAIEVITAGVVHDVEDKVEGKKNTLPQPQAGSTLLTANYYAADTLRAYMRDRIDPKATIITASLADLENLESAAPLGPLATTQIASRLSQYGYNVLETRLRNRLAFKVGQGELFLTRRTAELMSEQFEAQAALVGSYQVAADRIFVSVRVVRLEDKAVIASHEYFLPLSGSTDYLLDPQRQNGAWEQFASRPSIFASAQGAVAGHSRMTTPMAATPMDAPTRLEPPVRMNNEVEEMELFEDFPQMAPEELDIR